MDQEVSSAVGKPLLKLAFLQVPPSSPPSSRMSFHITGRNSSPEKNNASKKIELEFLGFSC